MKKTLVAFAALAVVGAASAQSSVTLYGRIDASIASQKTTVGGATVPATAAVGSTANLVTGAVTAAVPAKAGGDVGVQIRSGGHTGSRWGLKGSEDLGGGLKANFQLEQGFNVDNGEASSTRQFHRQAWVGVSGGFGSLQVGRQYDITDNMYGNYDPTGYSGYSAMGYAFNVGCTTGGSGDCVGRQDNTVMYTTPAMGGLSIAAMWAPGEDKSTVASAGKVYGIMANYANGPLGVGLGWQSNKGQGGSATAKARTDMNLGASYDLGVAKLYAQIENGKNKNGTVGKDTGYQLGAVMPMGAASLTASYAYEKQKIAGSKFSDSKAFALLAKYDLSKRTYVYAAYLRGETDPVAVGGTTKQQNYGLGLVHNF